MMIAEDLGLDYFHVYQIRSFDAGPTVGLQGQFDRRMAKVKLAFLEWFANPASKNGEPIYDKSAHLTGFRINTTEEPVRVVELENQFGRQKVVIGNGTRLLVPAKKRGVGSEKLGHYKVYRVLKFEGPISKTVGLKDQFGAVKAVVQQPVGFAVPVKKKYETSFPIYNEEAHLTIYQITPAKRDKPAEYEMRPIRLADQFGARNVAFFRSALLAVPSLKHDWK